MTVTMKASPSPIAISLSRVFSMTIFLKYSAWEDNNSEVMSRIIAVTASQRLMSDVDKGKFMFSSLLYNDTRLVLFGRLGRLRPFGL